MMMMRRVLSNPHVIRREFSILDKAGGMFGNMGDMMANMKKAAEVKDKAQAL
jgi:hypothetical protein